MTNSVLQLNLLTATLPNAARGMWQFQLYLFVHVIALIGMIVLMFLTMRAKSSKAQTAVVMFEMGGAFYTLGFIQEIVSDTAEGGFIACITQYAGEAVVFIALVMFVALMCSVNLPKHVYIILGCFSSFVLAILVSTRTTRGFYRRIDINNDGPFSRPELVHGTVFFVFVAYIFVVSSWVLFVCIRDYITASVVQRKRLLFIIASLFLCWIPYVITLTGVTGGYEIPALGIALGCVCLYFCFIKYGFFDSQSLAGTTALERGREGILVVDSANRVKYQNSLIRDVFGALPRKYDLMEHPILGDVLTGKVKTFNTEARVLEFTVEPFIEAGMDIGKMIWAIDATEHYQDMLRIREVAIRDTLTGLYNRSHFQELVEADLAAECMGTFVMFDMDNFKSVNDTYGHQCGDAVLNAFATVMKKYGEQRLYSCRLGGDEFCIFIRKTTERAEIEAVLNRIFKAFKEQLETEGYKGYTSLSAGASVATKGVTFKTLYAQADTKIYEAKTRGKDTFVIDM